MLQRNLLIGAGAVVVAGSLAIGWRVRSAPSPVRPGDGTAAEESEEEDAGVPPWCGEGLEPINGGGCFARPLEPGAPLVVYLHGIYEGDSDAAERDRQQRVAKLGVRRGFAVLALRGREGACSADPAFANQVCWPSNERTADRGPELVEGWKPALRAAAARGATGKRYVLGFSNGGFFAGLLAVRGWFEADAFVVANAGPVEPVRALGRTPPLLLMSADDDPSQEGMLRLDDELTREGWAHEHYAREGGHALTDDEIEAALTFFIRTQSERLPLQPPLSTHRPRPRVVEAAYEGSTAGAETDEPGQRVDAAPPDDPSTAAPTTAPLE